jgi:lysophospholipase L1-like esterase
VTLAERLFDTESCPPKTKSCRPLVLGGVPTDLYVSMSADDAAPNALIVVTGYPYLFEPDPNNPIITAFNKATAALNKTIKDAVKDTDNDNIVYVDVTKRSDEPFTNGPAAGVPEAFHPNAAGYRAYARAISAAIRDALDRQKQLA